MLKTRKKVKKVKVKSKKYSKIDYVRQHTEPKFTLASNVLPPVSIKKKYFQSITENGHLLGCSVHHLPSSLHRTSGSMLHTALHCCTRSVVNTNNHFQLSAIQLGGRQPNQMTR